MSVAPASRPTIFDVARECGLSKATVSKALNATPGTKLVSDDTRARVLEVAKNMGYRPSWRAQVLARKRSQTIAIAYSSPVGAVPRGVYFEIVDSLEEQLGARDYIPTFLHVRRADERVENMLGDGRFDGCISLGIIVPAVLEMLRRNTVPTVLINSGADASWTRVNVNDTQGAMNAMQHLLALGHRRILYYAGAAMLDHPSATFRFEAYRQSMIEAGLKPSPAFVGTPNQFVDHIRSAGADRPTAIVDFEHWSAIALLQALWRRGMRVPSDLSVITFNDTHPVAEVIPPLTTIALPARKMAEMAVQMLMKRLDQPEIAAETVTLDETLVIRESTAPVLAR